MSESPLHFKTVRELGDLVRSRQVSPVELAELSLSRLDTIGRELNAIVTMPTGRWWRRPSQSPRCAGPHKNLKRLWASTTISPPP